jgi:Ca2+-binding RTX toxin-like protein
MAQTIESLVPLTLPEDMVRVVFPYTQGELGDSGLPTLPDLLDDTIFRWNHASSTGTPVTVTYGFLETAPGYDFTGYAPDTETYRAFTDPEKQAVRDVFDAYEAVCGIDFEENVADPASSQMVCRIADLIQFVSGVGNFPPHSGNAADAQPGDFYIDIDATGQAYIAFHEIGHSLGLAHAFEGSYKPIPGDYGPVFADASGRLLSVVDQGSVPMPFYLFNNGNSRAQIFHPTTPMPLDILALQMIYGANNETNSGDTVYSYDINPNFYETIWDGGGNDTIDCSNQTNSCLISLVDGSYSTIGLRDPLAGLSSGQLAFWVDDSAEDPDAALPESYYNDGSNSLAIAFNAVIENAIGGSAADRLLGNDTVNQLEGLGGNDTLDGAAGNDTLQGGAGNDKLDGGAGNDSLAGGAGNDLFVVGAGDTVFEGAGGGTDTVQSSATRTLDTNAERLTLTGTNAINGNGNGLANILTGNSAANTLDGKGAADTLKGMGGNDTLVWASADTFDGGTGTDALKVATGNLNLVAITNQSQIVNTETINLTGATNNTLIVGKQDVLDLSSTTNQLTVLGNAGDTLDLRGAWVLDSTVGAYEFWKLGTATVKVETELNVI